MRVYVSAWSHDTWRWFTGILVLESLGGSSRVLAMKRVKCGGVRVDYSVHSATKMLNFQRIKRKTAFVVMTIIKFQCNNNSSNTQLIL